MMAAVGCKCMWLHVTFFLLVYQLEAKRKTVLAGRLRRGRFSPIHLSWNLIVWRKMKGNISNKKCIRKRQLHFKIQLWTIWYFARVILLRSPGAHQMEPLSPLISWVNPFPRRFINRTTFFCNAWIAWMRLLPAVWSKTILLSFLYFHWLFPLLAREIF